MLEMQKYSATLTLLQDESTGDDHRQIQGDYEDTQQRDEDVVEAQDARRCHDGLTVSGG